MGECAVRFPAITVIDSRLRHASARRVRTIRSFAPGITRDNSGIRGMPTLASGLRISSQLGPVETIPQTHRGPHGLSMIRSVKRAIVGMSGDPSNIRLMFVYRRARRVRWRLPPPPPSRVGARAGAHRRFLVVCGALSAVAEEAPEKRGTTEARWQPVCKRSSREPGFVVRGGRSRDTRPRKADGGSDLRPAECCRPGESARGLDPSYIPRMSLDPRADQPGGLRASDAGYGRCRPCGRQDRVHK